MIPEDVVEYFDIMDDGDISEPPTFSCEKFKMQATASKSDSVAKATPIL